jgi:hypothetical protein
MYSATIGNCTNAVCLEPFSSIPGVVDVLTTVEEEICKGKWFSTYGAVRGLQKNGRGVKKVPL